MNGMREGTVQCVSETGFHRMAYVEWGDPANRDVLLCVHGLTRCGRDFDELARAMSDRYRVVCPDIVGRGRSDWLTNKHLYAPAQYCADIVALLARLEAETLHWVGTSMGGLIGMVMAALPGSPLRRLVLNDAGPVFSAASLARIGETLGKAPRFDSLAQAEAFVRFVSQPFGPLTDAQWHHLTVHTVRQADDGKFDFRYDPGLAVTFQDNLAATGGKDLELWPVYEAIRCPTLLLRGAESDVLSRDVAAAMSQRGPRAQLIEFAGIGHAPVLMEADQIAPIREFLLQ